MEAVPTEPRKRVCNGLLCGFAQATRATRLVRLLKFTKIAKNLGRQFPQVFHVFWRSHMSVVAEATKSAALARGSVEASHRGVGDEH